MNQEQPKRIMTLLSVVERGKGNRHVRVETTLREGGSVAPLD